MSFGEDAFGGDGATSVQPPPVPDQTMAPAQTMTSQLASSGAPMPPDYQDGMTVNPADVMTRMLRKGLSERAARDIQRQQKPPDTADYGTPVTTIDPTVPPPPPPPPEPDKPVTYGDELKPGGVLDKAFAAPIVHGAGAALKAAGLFGAERTAYLADLASGRRKQHVGAPYGTLDTDESIPQAKIDAAGTPLFKAGQAVQDYGDEVHHLTPAEQDTWAARLAGAAGSVAPALAAGAVNPLLGMAVGGAQMGTQSAADTFDAAIKRGVDENTAAEAANLSGVVNTAVGMAPLGVVLRPLARVAPGLMGYAAAKLAGRAAEGAAAFATVGEAQEWIAGEIEKDFYPADPKDPKSGYEFDGKRFATNAIVGAVTGLIGHGGRGEVPKDTGTPDLTRARLGPPGETPPPDAGARPDAISGETPQPDADAAGENTAGVGRAKLERILRYYGFTDDQIKGMSHAEVVYAANKAMNDWAHKPGDEDRGSRANPVHADDIRDADHIINPEPTAAQAEAENYQHVHVEIPELGLEGKNGISIETKAGGIRKGPLQPPDEQAKAKIEANLATLEQMRKASINASQDTAHIDAQIAEQKAQLTGRPAWTSTMGADYGRIKGTVGADGQPLDIFVGKAIKGNPNVYILDQKDPATGKFDEHKIFAGFPSPITAYHAYLASHDATGRARIGGMRAFTPEEFKAWIASGKTTEPLSDSMKAAAAKAPAAPTSAPAAQKPEIDLTGMGAAMSDQLYDRLWKQVQAGETKELGKSSALLQAAKMVRDAGGLQTPEEFRKFAQEHSKIERGPGFQKEMRDLVSRWKPAAKEEPTAPLPQQAAGSTEGTTTAGGPVPSAGEQPTAAETVRPPDSRLKEENISEAVPTQAQVEEVRKTLAEAGVPPYPHDHVDIMRAIQIKDRELRDMVDAFQIAVLRNRLDDGYITPEQVRAEQPAITAEAVLHPEEAATVLEPSGASEHGVRPETQSAAAGGETAAPQPEGGATRGGEAGAQEGEQGDYGIETEGSGGDESHAAGGEPDTSHAELDTGGAATTAEAGGATKPATAGGEPAAESHDEAAGNADTTGGDAAEPAGEHKPAAGTENAVEAEHERHRKKFGRKNIDVMEAELAAMEDQIAEHEEQGKRDNPAWSSDDDPQWQTYIEDIAQMRDDIDEALVAVGKPAKYAAEDAAPDAPAVTTPETAAGTSASDWWDNTLTTAGRSDILKGLGIKLPPKVKWQHIAPETQQKLLSRKPAEPEATAQTPDKTPKAAWTEIGKNADGKTLFEDKNGVRSYLDGKVRVSEPVLMRPTKGGVQAVVKEHTGEWAVAPEKKKIEDAGEKIGGARKDEWGNRGLDVADLEKMNPAERVKYTTKENVWPRPDYSAMVEGGVDPKAAFLIKTIYDRLAATPNPHAAEDEVNDPGRLIRKYIRAMQIARAAAEKAMTIKDVESIGSVVRKAHMEPVEGSSRYDREGEQSIRIPNKSRWRSRVNPFDITRQDERKADRAVADGFPKTEPWQRYFTVHKWADDSFKVYRRGKKDTLLDGNYKTQEEAQAGARATYEAMKQNGPGEGEKAKEPVRPHLDSLERTGPDYRGGRNVDSADFTKDFGFRGVEFGNYVSDNERHQVVNLAYDALHDFARVMGLPPKALSLDGTMGMAFGARGKGGRVAAHYEPTLKVFNFTKINGAGSLAHEWAHALDHYLGELDTGHQGGAKMATGGRGKPADRARNLTDRLEKALVDLTQALFARQETDAKALERLTHERDMTKGRLAAWENALEAYKHYSWGPRKKANEMETARRNIERLKRRIAGFEQSIASPDKRGTFRQIAPTDYFTQASAISSSDYWRRPEEMFARAFEAWVSDKLTKEGNKSDYLVHGVEPTRFGQGYKGNPYPVGEERDAFNKGFDRLFRSIAAVEGKHGAGTKLEGARGEDPEKQTSISIPTEPAPPAPLDNHDFVKDIEKAGEETATTASDPAQPKPLAQHFLEFFRTGEAFPSIIQARRLAKDAGFSHDAKGVEEAIELAVVKRARELVEVEGKTPAEKFEDLRHLYGQQPNLGTRTSTSVREQAYSTPVPLAYVASRLADITHKTSVYEPTAGNGALLIEADPKKTFANEINPARAANLREQGFAPSDKDATDPSIVRGIKFVDTGADRVIANPPFGALPDEKRPGESTVFSMDDIQKNYFTTQIDHAIALRALDAMHKDGKAVLILGGINKQITDPKERSSAYNGKAKRQFFKVLYDRYNVVDHVTVDGDLYTRQGAGWPVDLVVIDGRGKSARSLPAVDVPRILHTWDEVGGLLDGDGQRIGTVGRPNDTSAAPSPTTEAGGGNGRGGEPPVGGGTTELPAEPPGPGDIQPGTVPNGGPAGTDTQPHPVLDQGGGKPAGHGGVPDTERPPRGLDDLDDILNDALDNIFGPEVKPEDMAAQKPEAQNGAPRGGKAKSKREPNPAGEMSEAAKKAMQALGTMFGGKSKLSMGITVDPEKYEQAKPLFKEAGRHFRNFIDDLVEFSNRLMAKLQEMFDFTRDALKEMIPYIRKFITDVKTGVINLDAEEKAPHEEQVAPSEKKKDMPLEQETALQVRYEPRSKAPGMGTLIPVNMKRALEESLRVLERNVGQIDDFVTKELGYDSNEHLWKHLGAEQVDALGLAIDNMAQGKGFIVGDQTGIGKGRVNAAIIRWAIKNDKIPVFFTKGALLYGDMYRDLSAIGIQKFLGREPKMLMTDANKRVPLDQDETRFLKTPDAKKHDTYLSTLNSDNFREHHDVVFSTYDQMNTIKGKETSRRAFLARIAPNAVMIFDESHNAGGDADTPPPPPGDAVNRAVFTRQLIDASRRNGTFYSSATYAKRPDVMDLYRATNMHLAVDNPDMLAAAITAGKVPMQQVVASMLSDDGQYARRERSFSGISYDTPLVHVDRDQYNSFSRALKMVQNFSIVRQPAVDQAHTEAMAEGTAVSHDGSTGGAGASSVNFTSVMHNIINQMLLASKAKPAADMAIEAIKRGEKPVLTVSNTMETFLNDYADTLGIEPGGDMPGDFRDLLIKYLDRTRTITIKKPFAKKGEKGEQHYLTDAELGSIALRAYNQAADHIRGLDLSNMSISPIDDIKSRIEAAGYKIGEITGRGHYVDFSGDKPVYRTRPGGEQTIQGKRRSITAFNKLPFIPKGSNSGIPVEHPDMTHAIIVEEAALKDIDGSGSHALLLNQAGSTGLSMHASETFQDQRQRHMVIVQPEANIDTHMQMLGRVHRTGQVVVPKYSQLVANIPAEKRPAAVLQKKMASLNANTTASRSSALTAENDKVPDFMNEVGDDVAANYIQENPDLNRDLGLPINISSEGVAVREGAMAKLTGRIPMEPLERQEEIYKDLEGAYKDRIEQMDAAGENVLEAKNIDLRAKALERTEVMPRKGNNPSRFAGPVYIEKATVNRLGKPMTPDEVAQDLYDEMETAPHGKFPANDAREFLSAMENKGVQYQDWRARSGEEYKSAVADFESYKRSIVDQMDDPVKADKERQKLDAIKTRWVALRTMMTPGSRITIKTQNDGNLTGIVLKVEKTGQAKNPLALGTWKVTFAIADASRKRTFSFHGLFPVGNDGKSGSDSNNSTHMDVTPLRYETYGDTLGRFESQQGQLTEQRYIGTGNLLRAYDWLNRKGQISNYTDNKGAVQQGIILPRNFDLDKQFAGQMQPLGDARAVMKQLDAAPNDPITSKDNNVRLENGRYGTLLVSTPAAKGDGGKYYIDKALGNLTDTGNFIKRSDRMVATVDSRNVEAAITRLQALGAQFGKPNRNRPPTEKLPEEGETPMASAQSARALSTVPAAVARREALEKGLTQLLERLLGKGVKVKFEDTMPLNAENKKAWGSISDDYSTAGGMFYPISKVIKLAMADPRFGGDHVETAFHEAVHALEALLANDKELDLMKRETPRLRKIVQDVFQLNDKEAEGLDPREVRAMAGEIYLSSRATNGKGSAFGVHVGLRALFERMLSVLRKIKDFVLGRGYKSFESMMDDFYDGKVATREARAEPKWADEAPKEPKAEEPMAAARTSGRTTAARPRSVVDRLRNRISDALGSDTATNIREGVLDYNERVRMLRDDVEAMHREWIDADGNLPDKKDFYELKRLFPGKKSARIDVFDTEHFDPLRLWMRENKLDVEDAGRYLMSLHAPERNRAVGGLYPLGHDFNRAINEHDITGGSGLSFNEAKRINAEYKNGPQAHLLPELRRRVDAIRDWIQNEMIRGSLESRENIDKWNEAYKNYVPLRGWEDPLETPEEVRLREMGGRGKGSSAIGGPEFKKAFGRKTLADNPLVNLLKNAYRTIDRAEKNRVVVASAQAIHALPEEARRALGVRIDRGAPKKVISKSTGMAREINNPADQFSDRAVPYKVKGATHFLLFDDPRIAEAMKRWSPMQLWGIFRSIQWLQNKWKSTITHYSPKFLVRHNARYYVENMLNALELKETGKYSPGKLAWEAFPVIGDATRAIFASEADGKGGGKLGAHWRLLKAEGGATSMRMMRDIDEFKEEMRIKLSTLGAATANPLRVLRETAETVNRITSIFDNAQRLAQASQALDQGMSPQKAALVMRDATVDYNLRGLWAPAMGIVQPFENVAVQTGNRMFSAQGRSSVMRKVMVGVLAAGLAMSAWNYLVGGTDTDGIPFFDKVAPWERSKNLVIMAPWLADEKGRPGVIKLPFPFNWAAPLSSGYAIGNFVWGSATAPQTFIQAILGPWISTFSQVGEEGLGLNSIIPEVMKAPYEIATNTDWKGSKIHIDPMTQHGPNSESGRKDYGDVVRTGEGWKEIAKALNYVSGGSSTKSGYFDLYPEDIRAFFDPYIGTQMRLGEEIKDTGASIAGGEAPKPSKVPLTNLFFGADYDAADGARQAKQNYEARHQWVK